MAELILGRLKFHWKGDWAQTTEYIKDDVVKYGPSVYVCVENHTSTTDFDTAKFELMSEGIGWRGEWSAGKYEINDIVNYGGSIYVCITDHAADNSTDTSPNNNELWDRLVGGLEYESTYDPATTYQRGDIVQYGGYQYINLQTSTGNKPIDTNYWEVLTKGYTFTGLYNDSVEYKPGELVQRGGRIYACYVETSAGTTPETTANWFVFADGQRWTGDWQISVNYAINDTAVYGGKVYVCIIAHLSDASITPLNTAYWDLANDGTRWRNNWDGAIDYIPGDLVRYGGQVYVCINPVIGSTPAVPAYWQLYAGGVKWEGDWTDTHGVYKQGDIVKYGGRNYICIVNHTADAITNTPTNATNWELLNRGLAWRGAWASENDYKLDDVVEYSGSSYVAVQASTNEIPQSNAAYWNLVAQGDISSPMTQTGDMIYRDAGGNIERLPIGDPGSILISNNGIPSWGHQTPQNDYYVSPQGDDTNDGRTPGTSWRTVNHACSQTFSLGQVRINVQAGTYEEQTPIRVGRSVVLEGNGLGAVTISPNNSRDEGFGVGISDDGSTPNANSYLFLMNNGARMRNFVFRGFSTGSVIVSLDPGTGPDDTSVWITSQSPYVQNCTSFTPGGTGFKIDGGLHNGGYKSMVANDWTQINSDGIGIHVLNDGRSEIVSVFTYYCNIGYLAETGGKIRAIVGNNSYGEYGAVARGFSQSETPLTGQLRLDDTTINSVTQFIDDIHIFTSYRDSVGNRFYVGHTAPTGTDVSSTFDNTASYPIIVKLNSAGSLDWIYTYESTFGAIHNAVELSDRIYCGGVVFDGGTNKGFILAISKAGEIQWQKTIGSTSEITDLTTDGNNLFVVGNHTTEGGVAISLNPAGIERWSTTLEYTDGNNTLIPSSCAFAGTPTTSIDTYALAGDATAENNLYIASYDTTANQAVITRLTSLGQNVTSYRYGDFRINSLKLDTGNGDGIYLMAAGYWNNPGVTASKNPLAARITVDGTVAWQTQLTIAEEGEFKDVLPLGNDVYLTGYLEEASGSYSKGIISRYTSAGTNDWLTGITNSTNNIWLNGVALDGVNVVAVGNETNDGISVNIQRDLTNNIGTITSGSYSLDNITVTIDNTTVAEKVVNEITTASVTLGSTDTTLSLNQAPGITRNVVGTRDGFAGIGTGVLFNIDNLERRPKDGSVLQIDGDDETYFVIGVDNFLENAGVIEDNNPNGVASLQNNKTWIQQETIGWIADQIANAAPGSIWEGFTYDSAKCERDVGLIVEALVTDLDSSTLGTFEQNDETVYAAKQYWNGPTSLVDGQIDQTVAAFAYMKGLVTNAMDKSAPAATYSGESQDTSHATVETGSITFVEDRVDIIINVVENGLDVAPAVVGSGTAQIQLDPAIPSNKTPNDNTSVVFREAFSQVRMSGHDFLDIGTGGFADTNYPVIIADDYTQQPNQERETLAENGGRVFYVTTDQDGNFRVGDYFKVEQATGRATLSSEEFDLAGLNELQLGSITAGKQGATINEFSTDGTFADNSDTSVPTEKATKTYIDQEINRLAESAGKITAGVDPTQSKVEVTGSGVATDTVDFDIGGNTVSQIGEEYIKLPAGTTADRPGTPESGMFRYNTDNQSLEVYGSSSWEPAGSIKWSIATNAVTVSKGEGIMCDTSGGGFILTLPASPQLGDTIRILDLAGTFDTDNLVIGRNGNNIMGLAQDLTLSTENAAIGLVYSNATYGWKLIEVL